MEKESSIYNFLKIYGEKKLISIQTAPLWPEEGKHVSDEVTLNFSEGSQIVVSASFDNVDTFFNIDEDVVFSIKEEHGHNPFCNIGETPIATILVDERAISIKVYFDTIYYVDRSISEKSLSYPIGLFIQTKTRSIGICRDAMEATWLDADYTDADESLLYSLDSRWGAYEDVDSFVVRRESIDYITDEVLLVEEKKFL